MLPAEGMPLIGFSICQLGQANAGAPLTKRCVLYVLHASETQILLICASLCDIVKTPKPRGNSPLLYSPQSTRWSPGHRQNFCVWCSQETNGRPPVPKARHSW